MFGLREEELRRFSFSTMSVYRNSPCLVFLVVLNIYVVSSDLLSDSAVKPTQIPPLSAAAAVNSVNLAVDSISMNLLSSFPEDLEISEYCSELLLLFGQRYVAYVNCLVLAARPVKVCQNCFSGYGSLKEIYAKISSDQMGPGNVSCSDSLLRSDRLMLVYLLYSNLETLWMKSDCSNCVTEGSPSSSLTSDTLYYMAVLNGTLTCFQNYQQGNHTELCRNCKSSYKDVNELYSRMEKNHTLCIDIEDSMNTTRRLWSKNFNCSFPREETVPVIAVSSFMLFLPIIFYLSSFLHSEQKKRKLIHPNRAKSYASLTSIQDKQS